MVGQGQQLIIFIFFLVVFSCLPFLKMVIETFPKMVIETLSPMNFFDGDKVSIEGFVEVNLSPSSKKWQWRQGLH